MQFIKAEIPAAKREELRALLNPNQLRQATWGIVSRTTNAAVRITVDVVQETVNVIDKYARRAIFSKLTRGDNPVGEVIISSKPIPIIGYRPTFNRATGVTVQILKDKPPIHLGHAFKAKVTATSNDGEVSSHTGAFSRARVIGGGGRVTKGGKVAMTPRGIAWRLPIKQVYGKRIVDVVDIPKAQARILEHIEDRIERETEGQLARFGFKS